MTIEVKKEATKIAKILKEGGIVIYPTDTIWGIGCDATNVDAVKKLISFKKRDPEKSMLLLVDHISLVEDYTEKIPEAAKSIAEEAIDPITIIYEKAKNLPTDVIAKDGSIGIRITNDKFCQLIIQQLDRPIISTSANISGEASPLNFSDISEHLIQKADYSAYYKRNKQLNNKPSSIIKISNTNEFKIIRS